MKIESGFFFKLAPRVFVGLLVLLPLCGSGRAEPAANSGKAAAVNASRTPAREAASTGRSTRASREIPIRPDVPIPPPPLPGRMPQLKAMYLDKKLFTPDHWWEYEEAEDERPTTYSVEQNGIVSLGGRLEVAKGALVRYRVLTYPTAAGAHTAFQRFRAMPRAPFNVRRTVHSIARGDEGFEVADTSIAADKRPVNYEQRADVRFGRYIVFVEGRSNLRALGPRPPHGERRWISEAVYDRVFQAAMGRWASYKTSEFGDRRKGSLTGRGLPGSRIGQR